MINKENENQESEEPGNNRGLEFGESVGCPFSMTVTPCSLLMISPGIFLKSHCQKKKRR